MSQDDIIYYVPTEIILKIFTYLRAKDITRCRQVCLRWKELVDTLPRNNALWREYCRQDFKGVYKVAKYKARAGTTWFHVYRSLSLWPKLALAEEVQDEFASASNVLEEIKNFVLLQNGIIGVHRRNSIVYYDIETLQQTKRETYRGNYTGYAENADMLVVMSTQLELFVIRKRLLTPNCKRSATFDDVKYFLLENHELYYVTLYNEIYFCDINDENLTSVLLHTVNNDCVMCLGYSNNHLNFLTFERDIYSIVNKGVVYRSTLGPETNLLQELLTYNFLERLDWRIYFNWVYTLNHTVPVGPLRDIVTVRSYGDVYFVGSNWGVLRIYYAPYSNGEFDLDNSVPDKQYNFMERYDCPVLSLCPILQIDVCEGKTGHTVLVGMPKKIALIQFTHNFKYTTSVAMLPYQVAQKGKVLQIVNGNSVQ